MVAICVDDEKLIVNQMAKLCGELPQIHRVESFTRGQDALDWLEENTAHLALLDINLPDINGIQLAARIKLLQPQAAIIFVTAHPQYAVDAFALHVSGYLLKPVSKEQLAREVDYALGGPAQPAMGPVTIRTFGNFDLLIDGEPVAFTWAKSKEILAYLVDRQGAAVTRPQLFAAVWGDAMYSRSAQKVLDNALRGLRQTLAQVGLKDLLNIRSGKVWVRTDLFECDLYQFIQGDARAINSFMGEYMDGYDWADFTESTLSEAARKYQSLV